MEKKELAIVTYIKKNGLDGAINTFKLKCKDYPNKVLLKYDQINSDPSLKEVQECRGLILEKDTWKVMSLAFTRFFNSAEGHAAKIDWSTAHVYEKLDGSLIQSYWDWNQNKWCAGTSGMAEAEGEVNEKPNTTFSDLFWSTIKLYDRFDTKKLSKECTYTFELMTPYNIVVCPHGESKVALLAVRNVFRNLQELNHVQVSLIADDLGLPTPKVFHLGATNAGHLIKTFEGMPYTEEGYVVCDANFNRVKIKNPAYLAMHHTKSKLGKHHILEVLKTNEVDEWLSTFPERGEEILKLKENLLKLIDKLDSVWDELKKMLPKNITKKEQKKFAFKVFEVCDDNKIGKRFSGLYFGLKDGKIESVREYINQFNNKELYDILID